GPHFGRAPTPLRRRPDYAVGFHLPTHAPVIQLVLLCRPVPAPCPRRLWPTNRRCSGAEYSAQHQALVARLFADRAFLIFPDQNHQSHHRPRHLPPTAVAPALTRPEPVATREHPSTRCTCDLTPNAD